MHFVIAILKPLWESPHMQSSVTRGKRKFKNVASSEDFHSTVRAIAGLKGIEMNEVCDTLLLPIAEKHLEKLKKNGVKDRNGKVSTK